MTSFYRNGEGYSDPTAGKALSNVMREYKERQKAIWQRQHEIKTRPRVYIVSPYAGDIDANKRFAIRCCRYAIDRLRIPVASHLLFPQMLDDDSSDERELGLLFGLALLSSCQEVWVFGNQISPGMEQEIREAKRLKKRIRYVKEVV